MTVSPSNAYDISSRIWLQTPTLRRRTRRWFLLAQTTASGSMPMSIRFSSGDRVFIENLGGQKRPGVRSAIEAWGRDAALSGSLQPDFNPIENPSPR